MSKYQIKREGIGNRKVVFLMTGWHIRLWMYSLFSRILVKNNFYCITYAYDSDVFSPDIEKTNTQLKIIRDAVLDDIKRLKKEGYSDFSIFGTSLGSMISLMIADKSPEINRIILNTTGIDVVDNVWAWDKVNPVFKNALIAGGITIEKLRKQWREITPANNIDNLRGKKILVYLAENDEIIPYKLGMRLINEFDKKNYDYKLIKNKKLNHFFTGLYNLSNPKVYLDFLK